MQPASPWKQWVKRLRLALAVVGLCGLTVLLIVLGYQVPWTGFKEVGKPSDQYYQPARTLWDWLQLLIVPLALAVGGFLLGQSQRSREQEIATDNLRETRLQEYLGDISELLLDKHLRTATPASEVRDIARTRTLVTLRRLDPSRKGELVKFLAEADLIGRDATTHIIDLHEADLRLVTLNGLRLERVSLSGAVLERADLRGAFIGVDFAQAILSGANFAGANLSNCEMRSAVLRGTLLTAADLSEATLDEADLTNANLRGALLARTTFKQADLRGADLRGATLEAADFTGATYNDKTQFPAGFTPPQGMEDKVPR